MEDVCELPNGYHLLREPNEAGGYTYFSDEVGNGVMVWDTCLVNESTLLTAIVEEQRRTYLEYHINRKLVGANKVWDLLVGESYALEKDRSEFLLWFKTSLPFYPQYLMSAQKPVSTEYKFKNEFGNLYKISFCDQMIKAKLFFAYNEIERKHNMVRDTVLNDKLKLISC